MKKEFNETSQAFKERLTKVEKVLEDRSIDNTMEGKHILYSISYSKEPNEELENFMITKQKIRTCC